VNATRFPRAAAAQRLAVDGDPIAGFRKAGSGRMIGDAQAEERGSWLPWGGLVGMMGLVKEHVLKVSLVFAGALFAALVGCAHKEEPAETRKVAEKPKASSSEKPANEIPLRDPDVANELPDERVIGATPRTVGAGAAGTEGGTLIARPPRTSTSAPAASPSRPPKPEQENKEPSDR
jgi:hypothetical protein